MDVKLIQRPSLALDMQLAEDEQDKQGENGIGCCKSLSNIPGWRKSMSVEKFVCCFHQDQCSVTAFPEKQILAAKLMRRKQKETKKIHIYAQSEQEKAFPRHIAIKLLNMADIVMMPDQQKDGLHLLYTQ